MMRLSRELTPDQFGALLSEYQRLLTGLFERMGGREVEVSFDSAMAAFPTAKQAAFAAVAAQRAVARHEWPHGLRPAISVALHSGEAGVGWVGPAFLRCEELCNAAEGGQISLSQATASLLEDEDLGELSVRDLGEQETRRTHEAVRVHELVAATVAETTQGVPSRFNRATNQRLGGWQRGSRITTFRFLGKPRTPGFLRSRPRCARTTTKQRGHPGASYG